jgi:glutamine amidotransferase
MCLLTYFKPGFQPDIAELQKGADHNSDGHGWALIAGGEILTDRGMDAETVVDQFRLARLEFPDGHAIFHSRIGTAGVRDETNCHPFPTGPSRRSGNPLTVVAHNGVLPSSSQPAKGDVRSDTRLFAERIMPEKFFHLDSPKTRKRFESWLGSFNKIAVLTVDPRYREQFYLFNEDQGDWKGGIWYSNQNHCWTEWDARHARKQWWEDMPDDELATIVGSPRLPGVWVSNGREGATFHPTGSKTNSELIREAMKSPYHEYTCQVCRVVGRIRIDTSICDYCKSCDGCWETAKDCSCNTPVAAATLDDPETNTLFEEYLADLAAEEKREQEYRYGL